MRILNEHARGSSWQSASLPVLPVEDTKSLSVRAAPAEEMKSERLSTAARLVPKDSVLSSSFAMRYSGYPFKPREFQTGL
jgi:hypothetical protein